jgi:hypothetical protein
VLVFFIAGLLSMRLERVISLRAYRIPLETGLLISSGKCRNRKSPIKGNVKRQNLPSARCRSFFVSAFSPIV